MIPALELLTSIQVELGKDEAASETADHLQSNADFAGTEPVIASAAYEEYLVPGLFKPWAEKLVELSSPKLQSSILDVACGTGIVARTAASKVGSDTRVTGLDINRQMINKATETAEREGLEIDWQQGDAGDLPFEDHRFDHLFCQQALQFFPDPQRVLKEMQRQDLRIYKSISISYPCDIRHLKNF